MRTKDLVWDDSLTLVKLLEKPAANCPNRRAARCLKDSVRFGELKDHAERIALSLMARGVQRGDRVAILMNNSIEYVEAFFAIAKLGGVVVPLNTFLTPFEISYILKDCEATGLLGHAGLLQKVTEALKDLPRIKVTVAAGGSLENAVPYESLLAERREGSLPRDIEPEDTAVIFYTSGTTGHPKGAVLSHRNILWDMHAAVSAIDVGPKDRVFVILPMFHAYTTTVCILSPLYVEACMIIVPSIRPFNRVTRELILKRPTIFVGIPPIFNIMSQRQLPWWFRYVNPVKLYISGASPLSDKVLSVFEGKMKVPLCEGYGLSEAAPIVTLSRPARIRKPGSVGQPLMGMEVKIVDEEENEVPQGETGELIVRGPNVMKGYLNMPEETAKSIRNGWLFTGDVARMDEEGYVFIVDRKKDLILVHGMNVYPREVEDVLCERPEVEMAAVLGRREDEGERVVAVIQLKKGAQISARDLRSFCRDRLASYKVPHQIVFKESLPLTPTMKIMKRALKKQLEAEWQEKDGHA